MGEVGIERKEFYYKLRWWEMKAIINGYSRRCRHLWSATRWQTFRLMEAQVGSDSMRKANFDKPSDLLPLPWDESPMNHQPTKRDVDEMLELMNNINAKNKE